MRWLQFIWREVVPDHGRAAGGTLYHQSQSYPLTTNPSEPSQVGWNTDTATYVGGPQSAFYELDNAVNRGARSSRCSTSRAHLRHGWTHCVRGARRAWRERTSSSTWSRGEGSVQGRVRGRAQLRPAGGQAERETAPGLGFAGGGDRSRAARPPARAVQGARLPAVTARSRYEDRRKDLPTLYVFRHMSRSHQTSYVQPEDGASVLPSGILIRALESSDRAGLASPVRAPQPGIAAQPVPRTQAGADCPRAHLSHRGRPSLARGARRRGSARRIDPRGGALRRSARSPRDRRIRLSL